MLQFISNYVCSSFSFCSWLEPLGGPWPQFISFVRGCSTDPVVSWPLSEVMIYAGVALGCWFLQLCGTILCLLLSGCNPMIRHKLQALSVLLHCKNSFFLGRQRWASLGSRSSTENASEAAGSMAMVAVKGMGVIRYQCFVKQCHNSWSQGLAQLCP